MLSKLLSSFDRNILVGVAYEVFFSLTDQVTKATPGAVIDAIMHAIGAVAQKMLKDVILGSGVVFIDDATGDTLDVAGALTGVPTRLASSGSSAVVTLVVTNSGSKITLSSTPSDGYTPPEFATSDGQRFTLSSSVVIPSNVNNTSFSVYANVRSVGLGGVSNVNALAINSVSVTPVWLEGDVDVLSRFSIVAVANEFAASGGTSLEGDAEYRARIKDARNILAIDTISRIENVIRIFFPTVYRVYRAGVGAEGVTRLAVVTTNGVLLSDSELQALSDQIRPYMGITNSYQLVNADFTDIFISATVTVSGALDVESVSTEIQRNILEEYAYDRLSDAAVVIRWDRILFAFQKVLENGSSFIDDDKLVVTIDAASAKDAISDKADILLARHSFPRFLGFRLLNTDGVNLFDINEVPVRRESVRQDAFNNFIGRG